MFHNCWDLTSRMCSEHVSTVSIHLHRDSKGKPLPRATGTSCDCNHSWSRNQLCWFRMMKNKGESSTEPGSTLQAAKYLRYFISEVLLQLIVRAFSCYDRHTPNNTLLKSFLEITSVSLQLAFLSLTF